MYYYLSRDTPFTGLILLMAEVAVLIDRLMKWLCIDGAFTPPISIWDDFIALNFIKNPYISFSLPLSGWGLNLIIFFLIVFLIYQAVVRFRIPAEFSLLILIILGAASNFLDRLVYGYVIDYLDFKYFTVFNIADAMIVIGVFSFAWIIWKDKKTAVEDK